MAEKVGEVYVDVKARGLQQAQRQIRSFLAGLGPMGAIAGGVMGGQLATAAFGEIKALFSQLNQFIREAVEKAGIQEQAELKLAQALRLSGQYSDELLISMLKTASAIQAASIYGDEQLIPVMAMFARTGKYGAEQIERMTRLTADLAAATGTNLETAARMVMRAIEGQGAGLTRIGIIIDQNILKSRDQLAIMAAIERQVSGTASVLANTWAGKLQQINNLWGDMQEKIGMALTKSPEMLAFLDRIKILLTAASEMAQKLADKGMWDRLGQSLSHVLGLILQITVAMARAAEVIAPLMAFSPAGIAWAATLGMTPSEYLRMIHDEVQALEELYDTYRRLESELEARRRREQVEAIATAWGWRPGPYAPIPAAPVIAETAVETATAMAVMEDKTARAIAQAREWLATWKSNLDVAHNINMSYEHLHEIVKVNVDIGREQVNLVEQWAMILSGGVLPRYEAIKSAMYSLQSATVAMIEGQENWGRSLAQSFASIATTLIPGVGQFLSPIAGALTGRLWDWLFGHGLKQEVNFRQEIVINIGEGMISEKAFWDNLVHYYILPGFRRGGMIPEPVGGVG